MPIDLTALAIGTRLRTRGGHTARLLANDLRGIAPCVIAVDVGGAIEQLHNVDADGLVSDESEHQHDIVGVDAEQDATWSGLRPSVRARLSAAVATLRRTGTLNRSAIMQAGEVTAAQASTDIREILHRCPGLMSYDVSGKRYVLATHPSPAASQNDNWTRCPSTHCERAQECRSPNECSGTGRHATPSPAHPGARHAD